jgi:SAM-dependent methyltransferase
MGLSDDRVTREKIFHENRFSSEDSGREKQQKFYSVTRRAKEKYHELIHSKSNNAIILEYGCGEEMETLKNLKGFKEYFAIDISEIAVCKCTVAYQDKPEIAFRVMNAEQLEFENNKFDVIYGSGILHHLDIDRSMEQIVRCLKFGGKAIFFEPLGHNPLINIYRYLTPNSRSRDEHPLLNSDLEKIKGYFKSYREYHFVFITLLLFVFRNSSNFDFWYNKFSIYENFILRKIPFIKKYCWIVVLELKK